MKRIILKRFLLFCCLILVGHTVFGQSFSFQTLFANHEDIAKVATNPKHQVQIIYTQINRDAENRPSFTSYRFQVDDSLYFYPASTVKMPVAFLALQRINELGINMHSSIRIGADRFVQSAVRIDSSSINNKPSIAHYIKKIFLVSDNDAFNRLYEFLGQKYINEELHKKGFTNSFIKHRLVGGYDGLENQFINPFWIYSKDSILYHRQGMRSCFHFPEKRHKKLIRGKGYWNGEEVIYKPFDFSAKNAISLQNLHDQLKTILFPDSVPENQRFHLNKKQYQFLYEWMSKLPDQSTNPTYNQADNYVKYILFGDEGDDVEIPEHIKIFNKPGWAYGFLTDVAYVIDKKENIEFLLAVQLLVNENQIFNDGEYEYKEIGIPFLGKLGKAIYAFEKQRKKKYLPDLSKFWNYATDHSSN